SLSLLSFLSLLDSPFVSSLHPSVLFLRVRPRSFPLRLVPSAVPPPFFTVASHRALPLSLPSSSDSPPLARTPTSRSSKKTTLRACSTRAVRPFREPSWTLRDSFLLLLIVSSSDLDCTPYSLLAPRSLRFLSCFSRSPS